MVVPLEFQDQVPTCIRAAKALSKLHGLASAGGKCDPLGARNKLLYLFSDGNFKLVLSPKAQRAFDLTAHRFYLLWMTIPQNHRPPRQSIVDILITIDIFETRALAVNEIQRDWRFGSEWAADSSG